MVDVILELKVYHYFKGEFIIHFEVHSWLLRLDCVFNICLHLDLVGEEMSKDFLTRN